MSIVFIGTPWKEKPQNSFRILGLYALPDLSGLLFGGDAGN
jgi:hypothetical protein